MTKSKEKITLYEQKLEPADLFTYLPASLRKRLSVQDKASIQKAFCAVVKAYQERYSEKYLDKMIF